MTQGYDKAGVWECSRCGYRDRAPPRTGYRGDGVPECRICLYPKEVDAERADRVAHQFGAEAHANRLNVGNYIEDLAMYYGRRYWKDLPKETKKRALACFRKGCEAESKYG